jgi:methyl-accepting chemotaxis protein
LEVQRIKAYAEGNMDLVRQIENQMAELRYSMGERAREMFEGLAGIDLQSIVNKWLDIFKEFGNNFSGAIDKINESIDDMIRNMVIQTAFVQPLLARLKAYMNTYAATNNLATDADGNYIWTDEAFRGMAEGLRGFIEGARQDFVGLTNTLNTLGLGFDSTSTRSDSQKGIATASQESVDRLDGCATAIQGHTFSINENTRIIKDNVAAIMGSVQRIETYTQHLIRMDNDLHSLRNAVQTVQTRGLSIRG